MLEKELVEESVLLAETIAAVEASRDQRMAEQVSSIHCLRPLCHLEAIFYFQYVSEVKQRAAFIYFSMGAFSQAEVLFQESGCDPREVSHASALCCLLFCTALPGHCAV